MNEGFATTPTSSADADALEEMAPSERLAWARQRFGAGFALTTSFGIQSSVLLHMLSTLDDADQIPVIWVDTGYLPAETYCYAAQLCERFKLNLQVAQSDLSPARMEALHGRLWETGKVEDLELYHRPVSYTHLTLPTIYPV